MIKALIFDFDGTLSNRQKNAYEVFNDYFRKYYPEFSDMEYEALLQDMMLYDCNGSISVRTRMYPFIQKYGKNLPDDFTEVFVPYYTNHMFEFCELKQETIEVLEKLKEEKYKLAIMSNGDSFSQHSKIRQVDIEKYFDVVVVSGDIGIDKPDKRIYEYVADKLGVQVKECLMVGDVFSTDILGAYNADMPCAWMKTDPEKQADYYKGYTISDLRQLFEILDEVNGNEHTDS
jgi:putative hydrolase of the HAD superfamily